jgi:hypothetical protein
MNYSIRNDFLRESARTERRLAWVTFLAGFVFLMFLAAVLFVPFDNYATYTGTFRYKEEVQVVSEVDGVIDAIYKRNFEPVDEKEPILSCHLVGFQKYKLLSPAKGRIYYNNDILSLLGTYVKKSQVVGYVYDTESKIAKITAPLNDIDRIYIGQPVILYYKNPHTLFSKKLNSQVTDIYLDRENNKAIAYCDIEENEDTSKRYPGTPLVAKLLINKRGLLKSLIRD